MHDLDLNYLYFLADRADKEEDSNFRRSWLESLKEHLSYMDKCKGASAGIPQSNYNDMIAQIQ